MFEPAHDWYIPEGFIENTENDEYLLYADTDSAYLLYDLPFNKFENIIQLVEYIQGIAKELGKIYNESLEYYLCGNIGLDPKYNTMDFKSEVIAHRGFFNTKKFYSLGVVWDEGTFFELEWYLKITGGQIKKSDITQLTKMLLTEVYNLIVLDKNVSDLVYMYRYIFVTLKNKYKLQIKQDIDNMDFYSFSVPKKWGSTKKTTPPFVTGAKLYNAIMSDTFRPGDSFMVVKIKINYYKLLDYFEERNDIVDDDKFSLQLKEVVTLGNKINVLSIPPLMEQEERDQLLNIMTELGIVLDYDDIILSNIDMKLETFDKLFDDSIRQAVL